MYIDSTITKPCIDEIIFCVAIVIHDRIERASARYKTARRCCTAAENSDMKSKPLLAQLSTADPTENNIFQAIKSIYSIAEFSAECLVISLLYIERLRSLTGTRMAPACTPPDDVR